MDLEIKILQIDPTGRYRSLLTKRVWMNSLNRVNASEVSQAKREDEEQAKSAATALQLFVSLTSGIPMEQLVYRLGEYRPIC